MIDHSQEAADRMLDGQEETRFGGFFVACEKVLRRWVRGKTIAHKKARGEAGFFWFFYACNQCAKTGIWSRDTTQTCFVSY